MRRLACAVLLCLGLGTSVGCLLPAYSGDPNERTQQLLFTSENMRALRLEWERFWFLDQPDHLTPHRTHGGVI